MLTRVARLEEDLGSCFEQAWCVCVSRLWERVSEAVCVLCVCCVYVLCVSVTCCVCF